jgi:redox-sensing transcriptional repressor
MIIKGKNGTAARIPHMVVQRYTKYLSMVQEFQADGAEWISSAELADGLGLTSSTVRQDLSYIDFYGVSKKGYEISGLCRILESILGADAKWKVVVAGAGNIGRALALHQEFARKGFVIMGLYDSDKSKIGKKTGGLVIQNIADMPGFISSEKIDIGIIAVPATVAQHVADLMVVAGIKGILNLAVTHLTLPRYVGVVDFRVMSSLLELTHLIKAGV